MSNMRVARHPSGIAVTQSVRAAQTTNLLTGAYFAFCNSYDPSLVGTDVILRSQQDLQTLLRTVGRCGNRKTSSSRVVGNPEPANDMLAES